MCIVVEYSKKPVKSDYFWGYSLYLVEKIQNNMDIC